MFFQGAASLASLVEKLRLCETQVYCEKQGMRTSGWENKCRKLVKNRSLLGKLELDEVLNNLSPMLLRFISDSFALSVWIVDQWPTTPPLGSSSIWDSSVLLKVTFPQSPVNLLSTKLCHNIHVLFLFSSLTLCSELLYIFFSSSNHFDTTDHSEILWWIVT